MRCNRNQSRFKRIYATLSESGVSPEEAELNPHVWRCVECGWVSGDAAGPSADRPVSHPLRMGFVCPQCAKLGITSRIEAVPLAKIRPTGEAP